MLMGSSPERLFCDTLRLVSMGNIVKVDQGFSGWQSLVYFDNVDQGLPTRELSSKFKDLSWDNIARSAERGPSRELRGNSKSSSARRV